jgi:hypothetical protein
VKQRPREFDLGAVNTLLIAAVLSYAVVRAATGEGIHLTRSVSAQVGDLLSFSLTCALLSYGTVEALKRVMRVRGRIQLWQTRRRLGDTAFKQLLALLGLPASGQETLRMFNLPTEQLSAQLATAADVGLTAGSTYEILITTLARTLPETKDPDSDAAFLRAQRVRAGIDRLQISLGEQWRRSIQGAAMWIAGLYGIGLVHAADLPDRTEPRYVLVALLLGEPIAWTLRDAAALLERARR